jgi:hypothetical protein
MTPALQNAREPGHTSTPASSTKPRCADQQHHAERQGRKGERSPSRRIDLYVNHDGRLANPDGAQTVVMRFGLRR